MRRFRTFLGSLLLAAISLTGCRPKHDDPITYQNGSANQAMLAARLHARDIIGGVVMLVADTHSMEPLLYGGYYVVVDTLSPYDSLTRGVVVTYHGGWLPPSAPPVTHRTQLKDSDGWMMAGDNVRPDIDPKTGANLRSEARWRMTKETYIGKVVAIYAIPR